MRSKFALFASLVLSVTLIVGCSESPTGVPKLTDDQAVRSFDGSGEEVNGGIQFGERQTEASPLVAIGHFKRQQVDAVEPDGSVSRVSFQASFIVSLDGKARGSFSLFNGESMVVYQITAGSVQCENGSDVVVLSGRLHQAGEDRGGLGTFEATVMEDDVDPECLIWDIKDGCSHEAQGKFDVFVSACR